MRLIEAAHSGDGDLRVWTQELFTAARPLFGAPGLNLGIGRRAEKSWELLAAASDSATAMAWWGRAMSGIAPAALDSFARFPNLVGSVLGLVGAGPMPTDAQDFMEAMACRDVLGMVALVDDYSLSFGSPQPERVTLTRSEHSLLEQVTLHVETGLRLRVRPASQLAILRPDGRLIHAEGSARQHARTRHHLSAHVGNVERGRGHRQRQQAESVQAWSALISGHWGLVERDEPSIGRHYAVLETTRASHLRALSVLEAHAIELSARRLTGKNVAYALGVTPATVSKLLASATLKLGLRNRTELVQLAARLLNVGFDAGPAKLTPTERDVLALVRFGWTNARIAQERKRSERTVANQVASLLEKLAVPSRRALATTR